MENIVRYTADFIRRYRLEGRPMYAGVSGGADSMALLSALQLAGFRPIVLHVNFSLRGEESDGDEAFVKEYCRKNGLECRCVRFDTVAAARESGESIEMAARTLRFGWFSREMEEGGVLFIAHNSDDVAETMLLNLCRGTGLQGLCGIREENGAVYRPLLSFRHEELVDFIERRGTGHREDRTNHENCAKRNILRNRVFPILKDINPRITDTMLENSRRFQEINAIFKDCIERIRNKVFIGTEEGVRIDCRPILESAAPMTVAHELFSEYGFSRAMMADMLALFRNPVPGKRIEGSRARILFEREGIYWDTTGQEDRKEAMVTGLEDIDGKTMETGNMTLHFKVMENRGEMEFRKDNSRIYLDMAALVPPLTVRFWKTGDRIAPFGMKGRTRLVSDVFNDNKYNRIRKENTPLVCDREKILWIAGLRGCEGCRVTSDTGRILCIEAVRK